MTDDPADRAPGAGVRPEAAGFEGLRPLADAVLYEGYLLYPYRRSSPKNRMRWQFGVLAPRAWAERGGPVAPSVAGSAESWFQQTECLLQAGGDDPVVRVRVRYLQLQHKSVERRTDDGRYEPVASLEAGGTVHLAFDEAVERETEAAIPLAALCDGTGRTVPVGAPGGEETEPLPGGAGRLVRRRGPVEAATTLTAEVLDAGHGRYRLRVRTENTADRPDAGAGAPRERALRHALIACHTFLGGEGLSFCSLTDPPPWAAGPARECRNLHTFPVLAGGADGSGLMLSSPILLPDHPRIAPESPGDLYDASEIDEILSLRTMLLTDEEKREARATDPRAARILDRVEGMPPEAFARLHGTIRSRRPLPAPPAEPAGPAAGTPRRARQPWWQDGDGQGGGPAADRVPVGGTAVARGSRVRLCPSGRGADAHDMFLAGRTARVAAVFRDVDGGTHLAVTLDDDPAAELHTWYGRFYYFRPDEIEPLAACGTTDEESADGRHRAVEA
ncbi:hypothetical protein [Streptomyces sp. YIM 98790]|uniref:hypothetical protein n=1 Tax=Streptomyces sp. YIM 98790 TaxID=2689077 RepID=UPI001FB78B0E|nr:hypothetical protein [Streptomyces sp. YIM 98790]